MEILVVDDAGQPPFCFERRHNGYGISVETYRLPKNKGPGLARKYGVGKAKGVLIAFLDSDDVYESGWLDWALRELDIREEGEGLVAVGKARNARGVGRWLQNIMQYVPRNTVTPIIRIVVCFFNPFYTPTVIASKELLCFHESLRWCEDYYTNALLIMNAERILWLPVWACRLGRSPGRAGGESHRRWKMWHGEFVVRRQLLVARGIKMRFKVLVILGGLYQCARMLVQIIIGAILR